MAEAGAKIKPGFSKHEAGDLLDAPRCMKITPLHHSLRATLKSAARLLLVPALFALAFAACERKPTEEEVAAKVQEEKRAAAVASPTPKPGAWMWPKKRDNPLDQKAKRP